MTSVGRGNKTNGDTGLISSSVKILEQRMEQEDE